MPLCRSGGLIIILFLLVVPMTADLAYAITIVPAPFDHFEVEVPDKAEAGEEFLAGISFVDRFGNAMPQGWKPDSSMTLSVDAPDVVITPSVLTAESYHPGFAFRIRARKMGTLDMRLLNESGQVLRSWVVDIGPGKPAKLVVEAPREAIAGETVDMTVTVVDGYGNAIVDFEPGPVGFTVRGGEESVGGGRTEHLPGGGFKVPVRFVSAGRYNVAVRHGKGGVSGSSGTVAVKTAPLDHFEVEGPAANPAGLPAMLVIRAVDGSGNPVIDYSSEYRGVRLYSSEGEIVPDRIPPSAFTGGVARTKVVLKKAGEHNVKISEIQGAENGFMKIRIEPGALFKFDVSTPDTAVAGEPFELTITALDEFGNRVVDLPAGKAVSLESTGTGKPVPDTVQMSSFRGGTAKVKVLYERAESFSINARPAGVAEISREDRKTPWARLAAEKAREEAVRSRREARLREERATRKAGLPAESATTPARSQPEPAPKPVPEPEYVKEPPTEVISPTEKTVTGGKPGVLDRISVVETPGKALVTFSTNGLADYNVTTSAKLSRKWIDLDFPALNTEIPGQVEGGEDIIGKIYVERGEGYGGIKVSVEILPIRIGYETYQDGDSLVLKVLRQ